jgi:zinc-ribbon domain
MRRLLTPILLLLITIVHSACIEVDIQTKIRPDGSGTQSWTFTTTALLGSKVRDEVQNGPLFKGLNLKFTEEYREGDFILKTQIPFQKVNQLKNQYFESQLEEKGFFKTTYNYREIWKPLAANTRSLFPNSMEGLGPNWLKISVEMDGSLIDSNADHVDGATVHWTIPMSQLHQKRELRARWTLWQKDRVMVASLLPVLAVIVLFFLLRKRQIPQSAEKAKVTVCTQCGSTVPLGSTFCNKCGNKL